MSHGRAWDQDGSPPTPPPESATEPGEAARPPRSLPVAVPARIRCRDRDRARHGTLPPHEVVTVPAAGHCRVPRDRKPAWLSEPRARSGTRCSEERVWRLDRTAPAPLADAGDRSA